MKRILAKRSTIAPANFDPQRNHYLIGDKYVRILTVKGYPNEFYHGLLAEFINNVRYNIDIKIVPSDLDMATLVKKKSNEIDYKWRKCKDPTEKERLRKEHDALENYIKELVNSENDTVNVITNIYIRGDSLDEVNKYTKKIKNEFITRGIKLVTLNNIQEEQLRNNSGLFIKSNLRPDIEYNDGVLMTTRAFAGLWPFIFDTVDDPKGSLLGREMTNGGKIVFDQFYYLNNKEEARLYNRSSGNMIVVGKTGTGKTTVMDLLLIGHYINGRSIVWIDPENKNEKLCKLVGGNYVSFGSGDYIINIFDLKPISTDSEQKENKDKMYDTKIAIFNVVEDIKITFKLLWPDLDEDALAMINEVVVETYKEVGIDTHKSFEHLKPENYPTFTNFTAVIKDRIEIYSKEYDKYSTEIKALKRLEMKMRQITGYNDTPGEWGRYFNGITTVKRSINNKSWMIAFGTKHLFEVSSNLKNALMRMVFQYSWSLCLGDDRNQTVFCCDEAHTFILNLELADILAQFQRRARKYFTSTLLGTQEVRDFTDPEILTHGKAIFSNSTYQLYLKTNKAGVLDLRQLVELTENEFDTIQKLPAYHGIFCLGDKHIPIEILATPNELKLIS